jgi:heme/copper-type cytochrome/quinol oxidase subunit 2
MTIAIWIVVIALLVIILVYLHNAKWQLVTIDRRLMEANNRLEILFKEMENAKKIMDSIHYMNVNKS